MEGKASIAVTVGAGEAAATWKLPKDLLTHVSPFFNAALNQPWSESTTESVDLVEDDPAAFRFFLHWLYSWTLAKSEKQPLAVSPDLETMVYLQAWILGNKPCCPRFQDFALRHIACRTAFFPDCIEKAYTDTPVGSTVRKWAALEVNYGATKRSFKPSNREAWAALMERVEDLAIDVVKLQIRDT